MRGAWPDCSVNTTIQYKINTTRDCHSGCTPSLYSSFPLLLNCFLSLSCILSHGLSITYFLALSLILPCPPPNSHMVHLLSCGYVLPVVDYISSGGRRGGGGGGGGGGAKAPLPSFSSVDAKFWLGVHCHISSALHFEKVIYTPVTGGGTTCVTKC